MRNEDVVALCGERGFELKGAEEVGPVLILQPEMSADLPELESLQELAKVIAELGYRYVTIELDEQDLGEVDG